MSSFRLKKKYQEWSSRENFKNRRRINVINFIEKLKKDHFKTITENNLSSNKKFRLFVKPFLTNKGVFQTDLSIISLSIMK